MIPDATRTLPANSLLVGVREVGSPGFSGGGGGFLPVRKRADNDNFLVPLEGYPVGAALVEVDIPHLTSSLTADILCVLGFCNDAQIAPPVVVPDPVNVINLKVSRAIGDKAVDPSELVVDRVDAVAVLYEVDSLPETPNKREILFVDKALTLFGVVSIGENKPEMIPVVDDLVKLSQDKGRELNTPLLLDVVSLAKSLTLSRPTTFFKRAFKAFVLSAERSQPRTPAKLCIMSLAVAFSEMNPAAAFKRALSHDCTSTKTITYFRLLAKGV